MFLIIPDDKQRLRDEADLAFLAFLAAGRMPTQCRSGARTLDYAGKPIDRPSLDALLEPDTPPRHGSQAVPPLFSP